MRNTELLSTADVAQLLRRDRSVISKWAKAGRIRPAIEGQGIRGARYFRYSEVKRFASTLGETLPEERVA